MRSSREVPHGHSHGSIWARLVDASVVRGGHRAVRVLYWHHNSQRRARGAVDPQLARPHTLAYARTMVKSGTWQTRGLGGKSQQREGSSSSFFFFFKVF